MGIINPFVLSGLRLDSRLRGGLGFRTTADEVKLVLPVDVDRRTISNL